MQLDSSIPNARSLRIIPDSRHGLDIALGSARAIVFRGRRTAVPPEKLTTRYRKLVGGVRKKRR